MVFALLALLLFYFGVLLYVLKRLDEHDEKLKKLDEEKVDVPKRDWPRGL